MLLNQLTRTIVGIGSSRWCWPKKSPLHTVVVDSDTHGNRNISSSGLEISLWRTQLMDKSTSNFDLNEALSREVGIPRKAQNANARSFKPKMWATPDNHAWHPVCTKQRHSPEMHAEDSPFYLAVNHHHAPTSFWYRKQPLHVLSSIVTWRSWLTSAR